MKRSNLQKQPTAYIMVGPPASGKSTWIRELVKNGGDYVVISSDDEVEAYAKSKGLTYSDVFDEYIKTATSKMKAKFAAAVKDATSNIIWDQTNLTVKKRKSILQQLPRNYRKIAVVFSVDDEELQMRLEERAREEGKFIPQHVVNSMKMSFEMPTKNEGFDEIITV